MPGGILSTSVFYPFFKEKIIFNSSDSNVLPLKNLKYMVSCISFVSALVDKFRR